MLERRYLLAAALLAAALAGGAWLAASGPERVPAAPLAATVLPDPPLLPDFRLRDQSNRAFGRDDLRGRTSLLFFGFTHCPDICPATLQQLVLARRQLAAGGSASLPEIILISVDPNRDTPEALARYVEYFGSGVTGLTGELDDLRSLTAALGIHFERVPATGGSDAGDGEDADYAVSHSSAVLVVDAQARLQALFSAPHSIESFVRDLPLLMASQ